MRYGHSALGSDFIFLGYQDYGFDYSDNDDDANISGSIDIENMYYKAKCGFG